MSDSQKNDGARINTPLGDDVLLLRSMTVTEGLGRLFTIELDLLRKLDLLSKQNNINFEDILGKNINIHIDLLNNKERIFNGFVTSFSQSEDQGSYSVYRASVSPWLWFLTQSSNCRIYQKKTVPDIVKEIFREHGYTDFEERFGETYHPWEYCVQYRETDFTFVSRLLEQEGIYYYFEHDENKHILVLADSADSHQPILDYEVIPYFPPDNNIQKEHISSWYVSKRVQPGAYELSDFDFTKPRVSLKTIAEIIHPHNKADYRLYDYPGKYQNFSEGDAYARTRIEEFQTQYKHVRASSNVRSIAAGSLFTLTGYNQRQDQNREYLVISVTHNFQSGAFDSPTSNEHFYGNSFVAINSNTRFVPRQVTPKATIKGSQTAIVVGPEGEEIYTDKYGRIKVQFHWDRYGKSDENSSCWVRVCHPWAGKNWGMLALPRIGQEVVVDFLEGDPDQPIIIGRVYNADNMPPYELPAHMTQTGIKSRSTKDGTLENFNEIRFEDKKGQEEIYIHAERNLTTVVEDSESRTIGGSRSTTISQHNHIVVKNGEYSITVMKESVSIASKKYISLSSNSGGIFLRAFGGDIMINADNNVDVKGGDSISLTVGGSSIEILPGSIKISSPLIYHRQLRIRFSYFDNPKIIGHQCA